MAQVNLLFQCCKRVVLTILYTNLQWGNHQGAVYLYTNLLVAVTIGYEQLQQRTSWFERTLNGGWIHIRIVVHYWLVDLIWPHD
ncbi:hypothetical protein TNCT_124801 [Trichonephila clavata]|uniref:Uncharacterized protein n=1 Tax=Trichonephila clavata TaxID=2740835 RepID=A0A8X6GBI0_TRICU|nr:hypothetical protein TNCT_124801 [Trichonephila clavata]